MLEDSLSSLLQEKRMILDKISDINKYVINKTLDIKKNYIFKY